MKRLVAGLLLAIGVLIAGLAGTCSGLLLVSRLFYLFHDPLRALTGSLPILLIGGLPLLIGIGLIRLARHMLREE